MNRRALFVTLALAAVAATSWLSRQTEQAHRAAETRPAHTVDYFLSQFSAIDMDESGHPRHRLDAAYMAHFPDDDTSELTAPRVTVFRPQAEPWRIQAARGRVEGGGDLIYLQGEVQLQRSGEDALELTTDDMRIWPDRQYAETDAPLTVTSARGTIEAVGMHGYLGEERLELLSGVKGTYGP